MPTLLHLDSSPLESSISRELTREFARAWNTSHRNGKIIYRDLAANPPAPINAQWIHSSFTPEDSRTPDQRSALASSEELISELEQADEIVVGVPMHNFSIPAPLKLWIDQIARNGRTFVYGEAGPKGLLTGKKATVLVASGGVYEAGTPLAALNFIDPYLKTIFGFIGITDVKFVTAGGAGQLIRGAIDRDTFLKPTLEAVRTIAM